MNKKVHEPLNRQLPFENSSQDVQRLFAERARNAMAALGIELLEQETRRLAGEPFSRKTDELVYRGGSAPTSLLVDGAKIPFKRQRLRDAKGREVPLPILEKLRDQDLYDQRMLSRIMHGVSTRNYQGVIDEFTKKTGISKSSVSRAFKRASQKDLDAINHADLASYKFISIMIDGTGVGEKTVVVAIGITDSGEKIPLGIREGDTENKTIVEDLLSSLIDRKFTFAGQRILAVLDGGKALKSAVKALWGDDVVIQRCSIHKLRNVRDYLPKENHGQLFGRFKKIMGLNSFDQAKREMNLLHEWLLTISNDAAASLKESGDDILALHKLGVSGDLRKSLCSTNLIESLIGVVKTKSGKVSNWGYHPKLKQKIPRDKILRWVASSIQTHRPKFRRIRGVKEIQMLIAALDCLDQIKIPA